MWESAVFVFVQRVPRHYRKIRKQQRFLLELNNCTFQHFSSHRFKCQLHPHNPPHPNSPTQYLLLVPLLEAVGLEALDERPAEDLVSLQDAEAEFATRVGFCPIGIQPQRATGQALQFVVFVGGGNGGGVDIATARTVQHIQHFRASVGRRLQAQGLDRQTDRRWCFGVLS